MSTSPQDAMPLLCELGWHRPDKLARWNDGYYFSKCSRCGRDLVRTAYGSWQLPKGYRVVWQPKPPETLEKIALVPSGDLEAEGPRVDQLGFPVADVTTSERAPVEAVETKASAAPSSPVPERVPSLEEPRVFEEPAPPAEPQEAAAPPPEPGEEPAPIATDEPPSELSDPARALDDVTVEPVSGELAEPTASGDQLRTDVPIEELLQQPNGTTHAAEPAPSEDRLKTEMPVEELLQQPEGTAHTVEQHLSIAGETQASPADDVPAAGRDGRRELPIAEVLRHLNATPMPEVEAEPEAEAGPEISVTEDAGSPNAQAAAPRADQPLDSIRQQAVPTDEPAEVAEADESAAAEASAVSSDPGEQLDAGSEPDSAELPFEPALPPRPAYSPAPDLPPGWDFMAEEEEDPIGTFWDDPAATSTPQQAQQVPAGDVSDAAKEPAQATGEPLPGKQRDSVAASEQPQQGRAFLFAPRAEPVAPPQPVEQADLIAAPAQPERTEPAPTAGWPRWMDADAEAEATRPQARDAAAAERQTERAVAPGRTQVEALVQPRDAERSDGARKPPEPDDVPPWVDATDEEASSGASGSRSSRFAVTAIVSIGVLALAAALAGRPGSNPNEVPQQEAAPAPVAAPAPKEPVTVSRSVPDAATKMPFAKREPAFISPGRPVPMPLPAPPAREQAFVTASVLQCRSAPVNQSPAVRKLVRGAEVQILARDGAWASVAHKGRQCWAAARFLSTAQPL